MSPLSFRDEEARNLELQAELKQAIDDYEHASESDKPAARVRCTEKLQAFRARVLR